MNSPPCVRCGNPESICPCEPMTTDEQRLVSIFMEAQATPEGRMFSYNILSGIKAVLKHIEGETPAAWLATKALTEMSGEAMILAEQWKGRADDAGRLSRAVLSKDAAP